MLKTNKNEYIFSNVSKIKGVGSQLSKYLKNKKIEKIKDLLWDLPYSFTDRTKSVSLDKLEIGSIVTIKVKVIKYNFPRIRNLPNKISCEDDKGKIDIIFFNTREGYIRKVLPLNSWVVISGKISYFKKKYQITNPDYITSVSKEEYVKKIIPKYSLTEGLTEKSYRKIIEEVLKNLPDINEWHNESFLKIMKFPKWKDSILDLHKPNGEREINSNSFRRLAFDEILSHMLILNENRKKIRKNKKKPKKFHNRFSGKILENLDFKLTLDQLRAIKEINGDLASTNKMFRILQGDVGSGKTVVCLISALNVIESEYQCALMAPTEILAKQHYNLVKKIFPKNLNVSILTGKTDIKEKKIILKDLKNKKIDLIIGTHSLFQNKTLFGKLGLVIVDEQHKFGVKQRMNLAKKGGDNCDVLLMSATPIPRTMMMTIYGDLDVSQISEKPKGRKNIITLSKPEEKINELWPLIKKNIKEKNQVFWVCPLIDESKNLNYSSAIKKFEYINKKFPQRVGLIHGSLNKFEKERILNKFLKKEIDILVSTTVIEVGIDFPDANLIIIENANKFGLAQLHQLRGRVGRGSKEGMCVLLYKKSLSSNAVKRIKILKSSDNGFFIAEEDMKLRGFGDIIGFQQSGIKYFRLADPVHHSELFKIAESHIKEINASVSEIESKYSLLLKLFDKAEVISDDLS